MPPPAVVHKKKITTDSSNGVGGVVKRNLEAIPLATVPRQRRIRDSDDDDDDDIPVSRKAIAALLPLPQPKMSQLLALNDDHDDEIVLLRTTQSTQQGATNASVVASSAAPIDISAMTSRSALNTVQLDDNQAYERAEDDDAPMVHPSEMNHNVIEPAPSASRPSAAASSGMASTSAARPKLKGLGSLVRRSAHALQTYFPFALHRRIRPLIHEQTHTLVQ